MTNNHVVDGASSIRVTLDDGREFDATLLGTDPKTDLAVLKVEADGALPFLAWGDSGAVQAGDRVIAIGNPFGIGTTVTAGIVSALGRDLHNGPYDDFLQIDAALNHGNSGGPLVDTHGQVVGIDSAIFSPNDGNVGVGFAIPSDLAEKIVDEIVATGTVERGYLGVQIQPVTDDIAQALGLDDASGALVASVEAGTPAASAGVEPGDVILSLDGQTVATPKALSSQIADLDAGQDHVLGIIRQGDPADVTVTLASYPSDAAADATGQAGGSTVPDFGFEVSALTPELRTQFGLDAEAHGVVVTAVDDAAEEAGLRQGDVIVSVAGTDVGSVSDLTAAIEKGREGGRGAALLLVERDGQRTFLALPYDHA